MKKLAIITTHPIQYNAPWFRLLAERNQIQIKVFYTWSQSETGTNYDPGFGKNIKWDIPLLDGYEYEFVKNIATNPGTRTHSGIVNPQLIEKIKQYHPDAILINGWNFNSHLKCLRYFHKKIPVLFRGDSTLLDKQKGFRKVLRQIILKWVYGNVDYALYTGKQNKKYFLRHGLKEDQLIFVPHAIDNERFACTDTNRKVAAGFRKKLIIAEGDTIFLFAGKFERKKDPQILIDAFKTIWYPGVHLILVGNGQMEKELQQSAGDFENIHFLDFQNQKMMPAVYQMADVFVLPSKGPGETWGLAVNEAMAAGKPILISNKCGCAADLLEDGINGFGFESENVSGLSKKMIEFIEKKNELREMGEESLLKIKNYSFGNIASQIENLMVSL
jgi:glycosyltransferase involved in cell wall biosynthesis